MILFQEVWALIQSVLEQVMTLSPVMVVQILLRRVPVKIKLREARALIRSAVMRVTMLLQEMTVPILFPGVVVMMS